MSIWEALLAGVAGGTSQAGPIRERQLVEEREQERLAMEQERLRGSMASQGMRYEPVVRTPPMPEVGYGEALASGAGAQPEPKLGMAAGTEGAFAMPPIMPEVPDFSPGGVEVRSDPWVYDPDQDPRMIYDRERDSRVLERDELGYTRDLAAEKRGNAEWRARAAYQDEQQAERDRRLHEQRMAEENARAARIGSGGSRTDPNGGDPVWRRQRIQEALEIMAQQPPQPVPGMESNVDLAAFEAQKLQQLQALGFNSVEEVTRAAMELADPGSYMPPPMFGPEMSPEQNQLLDASISRSTSPANSPATPGSTTGPAPLAPETRAVGIARDLLNGGKSVSEIEQMMSVAVESGAMTEQEAAMVSAWLARRGG